MTSNLGSAAITGISPAQHDEARLKVMDALRANFRPEFLNRIDEVIVFTALSRDQIGEIVEIQLETIAKRLASRRISLILTPAARDWLATRGYDPVYGARPLKRLIQKEVLDPLAMRLLNGQLHEDEVVTVDAIDGTLTFNANLTQAPMVA